MNFQKPCLVLFIFLNICFNTRGAQTALDFYVAQSSIDSLIPDRRIPESENIIHIQEGNDTSEILYSTNQARVNSHQKADKIAVANTSESIVRKKRVLLVESSIKKEELSFLPFRTNYGNYTFDDFVYASSTRIGTGYGVELNLPSLHQYEMIFIKMDMGSFSENMIRSIADYILAGGKVYIIYDAYDRAYYLSKMEENTNQLLKYLQIDDNLRFSQNIVDNQNKSGVINSVEHVQRSKKLKDRRDMDASFSSALVKPVLTSMGKGFYIKSASDMSEANAICQFKNDEHACITNVFWTVGSGGLGIGTEKITSAYQLAGSMESWKVIESGFRLNEGL